MGPDFLSNSQGESDGAALPFEESLKSLVPALTVQLGPAGPGYKIPLSSCFA